MDESLKLTYRPMRREDLAHMHEWLNRAFMANIWDGPQTRAEVEERYGAYLNSARVHPYIIFCGEKPVGYLQSYDANAACDGWWENELPGTWGVDQFIADEALLGRGLGSDLLRSFTNALLEQPKIRRIIVDPAPDNTRAIRAYQKAGFEIQDTVVTPDGPALLMQKLKIT